MIFEFGKYQVDIDVEETRKYYTDKMSENDCDCTGCINFRKYAEVCDLKIKNAFSEFGIDNIKQIYEIIPYGSTTKDYNELGGIVYGGFFSVVGKVITDFPINPNESTKYVTDKFEFFLAEHIGLKPNDFPKPTIQIEIFARIPWILECENDYLD